jgi:hypothetical protein
MHQEFALNCKVFTFIQLFNKSIKKIVIAKVEVSKSVTQSFAPFVLQSIVAQHFLPAFVA